MTDWKPVAGTCYLVSRNGEVKNATTGRILSVSARGVVVLTVNGRSTSRSVSSLVRNAFGWQVAECLSKAPNKTRDRRGPIEAPDVDSSPPPLPSMNWTRRCNIPGCRGKHAGRGLCQEHYNELRSDGNLPKPPHAVNPPPPPLKGIGEIVHNGVRWRDIPGFVGRYIVSDQGIVYSLERWLPNRGSYIRTPPGEIRGTRPNPALPYLQLKLYTGGKAVYKMTHRVVLEAFVGPCPEGMEGCHNNGNSLDNRLANLRWDYRTANMADKTTHGTDCPRRPRSGRTCNRGHVIEGDNAYWHYYPSIRTRRCVKCHPIAAAKHRAERPEAYRGSAV